MSETIIDTDILSFYFKGYSTVVDRFDKYLSKFEQINISIITYYEIIGGLKFKKAEKQLRDFETFASNNNIIYISEQSAYISGGIYADLRRKGIIIGTSDILIAGIAIENELTLVTNNENHYRDIPNLKLENWNK